MGAAAMREVQKRPRTAPDREIGNRLFTEQSLLVYGSTVAVTYAVGFVLQLTPYKWRPYPDGGVCTDFVWIWLSSKFASWGALAQAYDYSVFSAARLALFEAPNCILEHFDYPPTLLLFTYPLGLMPYPAAFAVWMAATLLLYLTAVYAIIQRPAAIIAALTSYAVFINVVLGHNGFLTAGLIGLALAFMERRPWLSGIFLRLLTYKPQFGILFPFALFASRNWRVFLSATATSVMFAVAAAIAFGCEVWPLFIDALVDRASSLSEDRGLNLYLVSVFGFLRLVGVSADDSWTVQLAVSIIVAVAICVLWARPISHSLKAAAGKAGKPTEFGKMVKLQEPENQIVVAYEVYDQRPSDSDLLIAAIETHQATLGCTPHLVAADLPAGITRRAFLFYATPARPFVRKPAFCAGK
jgi:hypothetical protein